MIYIPKLNHEQLGRIHGMSLSIPRIDDSMYKCELILEELYTNEYGDPPAWVLSQEGEGGTQVITSSWPADMPWGTQSPTPPPSSKHNKRTTKCPRLSIQEGRLISEFANGQSGDQQSQPMARG